MAGYDHLTIEKKWQSYWRDNDTFLTRDDRSLPKYYVLDMFPYPSGVGLHVGHPKGYVATDVMARARRMMGYNVLRVMGWDSFGLPSERQAVREGIGPREVTERNIATFKDQLTSLGLSYDWSREFATSDPEYYKWTQWIFLKLFERGLAYEEDVPVNWCPALGTVLANEEVKDGVYIETGDPVERRSMRQWMLRITEYADKLLDGLDALDWPEGIKESQRNWIGRSEGAAVVFPIQDSDTSIEVFTTRPDTLFGCTYLVLAPEHPLVSSVVSPEHKQTVSAYCEHARRRSERDRTAEAVDVEKTGVFSGSFCINPVNGEAVPIWVADYVLATYGTGAVYACPAHDERDYAFATRFDLPIIEVVQGGDVSRSAYTGEGSHINSDFLDGLDVATAKQTVIAWLEDQGLGSGQVNYRLRDWLFSRQRYWGEPIPVVHSEDGKVSGISESELPVTLPELDEYRPTDDGRPPLARAKEWVEMEDPETGRRLIRETNTMPQWAGSCWYYLRFINPNRDDVAWDPEDENYWMPVDLYVGGAEHATLHLLYARFWHRVLYDIGVVSTPEPFQALFNQGMIHATSYRDTRGKYYYESEVENRDGGWRSLEDGRAIVAQREKMSKSKYNVVNPEDMCREYGADSLRLYELFMGPLEDGGDWDTNGVAGCRRFLDRAWRVFEEGKLTDEEIDGSELERALHIAIRNVTDAVDSKRFNTAISDMMVFVNEATRVAAVPRSLYAAFVTILAPFAPHVAEELWHVLGHQDSITYTTWPTFDESKIRTETIEIAVQVNGKLRATLNVDADAAAEDVVAAAKAQPNVQKFIDGKAIRKEIVVPSRLVNLVV
ncbi:MAG: leucine--tRNA ligase [Pseudomonadota bacterium]|nr:leucine--tRNA ligase [Pseudomonadota bacterium]